MFARIGFAGIKAVSLVVLVGVLFPTIALASSGDEGSEDPVGSAAEVAERAGSRGSSAKRAPASRSVAKKSAPAKSSAQKGAARKSAPAKAPQSSAARSDRNSDQGPDAQVAGGSDERAAKSGGGKKSASKKTTKKAQPANKRPNGDAQPASKAQPNKAQPATKAEPANRGGSRAAPAPATVRGGHAAPTKVKVQTGSRAAAPAANTARRAAPAHHAAASNFRRPSGAVPAGRAIAGHRAATRHHAVVASHRHAVAGVRHRAVVAGHHHAWVSRHRAVARHRAWVYRAPHARWYHPWAPGRPYHWYHGVFVYGPRPVVVVHGGGEPAPDAREPERQVDRTGQASIGLRGGSYMSQYTLGGGYGDLGLGLAARYRAAEALGFELQWTHHDQSWSSDSERTQDPISASVEVFGFPWAKVNPYVLAGLTVTPRDIVDQVGNTTVVTGATLWGPHGGLGLEVAVGENASINLDGRWVGYINRANDDLSYPGAFQGNLGVNFYF